MKYDDKIIAVIMKMNLSLSGGEICSFFLYIINIINYKIHSNIIIRTREKVDLLCHKTT